MSIRVDTDLLLELKDYGDGEMESCFNCGNCTAICPYTSAEYPFPRNMIRLIQVGAKDKLKQSLDPWLCYYCGDCSETCPRGAEPGEVMMSLRRWLTAQYDWTGLARKFYTSKAWEFGAIVLLGLFVAIGVLLISGPAVTDHVELNTFAPAEIVHIADWIMAGMLVFFITTNVLRMHKFIMRDGIEQKIPLKLYFTEAWQLILHFATQKRWAQCDEGKKTKVGNTHWITHLLLVSGYVLMLVLIMFFLKWFQTDEIYPIWHPQRWLGYYATIVLVFGAGSALWGRFKKSSQLHRFSHASDWIFPVLLLAVSITGILIHTFRYLGLPLATYYIYIIHLAFAAPMLILEVPFGKWSHLYYRPLAIYFQAIKAKAQQEQITLAPVPVSSN
ncbi:MAG: 4Fe-4S dicluster domain-containing protein [Anaerolineales bacterium]|nr:4Fe-4S dicluster domain-containing protein [Anaerolineales bacterium]